MATLLKQHIDFNNESPLFFDAGDKLLKKAHKVISSKSKEDFQEFNAQFPIYDYLDGDCTHEKFAVVESINLKVYGGKSALRSDELFVHLHHEVSDYMHYCSTDGHSEL